LKRGQSPEEGKKTAEKRGWEEGKGGKGAKKRGRHKMRTQGPIKRNKRAGSLRNPGKQQSKEGVCERKREVSLEDVGSIGDFFGQRFATKRRLGENDTESGEELDQGKRKEAKFQEVA